MARPLQILKYLAQSALTGQLTKSSITNSNLEKIELRTFTTPEYIATAFSSPQLSLQINDEIFMKGSIDGRHTYFKDNTSNADIDIDLLEGKICFGEQESHYTEEEVLNDVFFISTNTNYKTNKANQFLGKFRIKTNTSNVKIFGYGFDELKGNLDLATQGDGLFRASGLLNIEKGTYKNLGKVYIMEVSYIYLIL